MTVKKVTTPKKATKTAATKVATKAKASPRKKALSGGVHKRKASASSSTSSTTKTTTAAKRTPTKRSNLKMTLEDMPLAPRMNFNKHLTKLLGKIEKQDLQTGNKRHAAVLRHCIDVLSIYNKHVDSGKEAKSLPGIGAKSAQLIDELLDMEKTLKEAHRKGAEAETSEEETEEMDLYGSDEEEMEGEAEEEEEEQEEEEQEEEEQEGEQEGEATMKPGEEVKEEEGEEELIFSSQVPGK